MSGARAWESRRDLDAERVEEPVGSDVGAEYVSVAEYFRRWRIDRWRDADRLEIVPPTWPDGSPLLVGQYVELVDREKPYNAATWRLEPGEVARIVEIRAAVTGRGAGVLGGLGVAVYVGLDLLPSVIVDVRRLRRVESPTRSGP